MVSKEDNPLTPLNSVRLTDGEKERIWENIVQISQTKPYNVLPRQRAHRKRLLASIPFVALGALVLVGYTNPQLLNIGKAFDLLKLRMFSPPQVSKGVSLGYGEKVNQSVTRQGITLTIGNVYADPTKLEFDMVESFVSGLKSNPVIQDGDISLYINGTRKLTDFSGGDFLTVSGGKYAGVVFFPVMNDQPYTPLPDTFTLNVKVHQIGNIKGNWSFSIPVSQQKLQHDTKAIRPNVSVSDNGYTMKITNVTISPVQMVIVSTMDIPANEPIPNRMEIIDSQGQVIGGGIENEKVVNETYSNRVIQMIITSDAPSKGATYFSITPMRDSSTRVFRLKGVYPKQIFVLPGVRANVTGIDFNAKDTVVHLFLDQAAYRRLTTYKGHSIEAQFFLVNQGSTSSDFIGSTSVKFDSPTADTAQILFGKVDANQKWGLEKSYSLPQSGLEARVDLK